MLNLSRSRRLSQLEKTLGMKQEHSILVIRSADPDDAEVIVLAYGFSKEEREELQAKYAAENRRQSHSSE